MDLPELRRQDGGTTHSRPINHDPPHGSRALCPTSSISRLSFETRRICYIYATPDRSQSAPSPPPSSTSRPQPNHRYNRTRNAYKPIADCADCLWIAINNNTFWVTIIPVPTHFIGGGRPFQSSPPQCSACRKAWYFQQVRCRASFSNPDKHITRR